MTDTISITIPLTVLTLRQTGEMFLKMADELAEKPRGTRPESAGVEPTPKPSAPVPTPPPLTEKSEPVEPPPAPAQPPIQDDFGEKTHVSSPEQAGPELDSDGLPWDSRINVSTKTKLARSGQWRLIPGIDKAYVEEVRAELMRVMSAPVPTGSQTAETSSPPATPSVPVAPPRPSAPPPPQTKVTPAPTMPVGTANDFEKFTKLTDALTSGEYSDTQINQALDHIQLPSVGMLVSRLDLVQPFADALGVEL